MAYDKEKALTRQELDALIGRYAAYAHEACAEALDPELSQDMCEHWASLFVQWLTEQGVHADVIVCEGSTVEFTNHSWNHRVVFDEYWHVVASVGGWHVDWSRRQFEVDAPVPHVITAEQGLIDWRLVMERQAFEDMEAEVASRYDDAA